MKSKILFIIILFFSLISCSKEIKVDLPKENSQLVVEGYIELNKYPIVYLTKTKNYTDKIDSSNVFDYIASVAKVTISNGDTSEILTLRLDTEQFPFYYFEGTEIKGEVGKTYTITIELSGEQYESTTTILPSTPLSSYEFIPVEDAENQNFINIKFQDPPEVKNYYRVYIKRINKDNSFKPCYLSTFNDNGFNGKQFSYQIIRNYSASFNDNDQRYFVKGDSIMVKFCVIDEKTHEYWKNIEGLIAISANPFGLATNTPASSFTNGALGIWCGLSSKYYLIVIN